MFKNKVPPPIIALVCVLLMWLLSLFTMNIGLSAPIRISLLLVILLAALAFIFSGIVSFRRADTTIDPMKPETASSLVSTGIYRVSRNPMYVGLAMLLVAWLIYLSSPLSIIGVIAFIFYINEFQIKPEERALEKKFGLEFTEYKLRVRRWI